MKKILSLLLVVLLAASLGACGSGTGTAGGSETNLTVSSDPRGQDRLSIVTTIFPEYDWVQNILGENPAGIDVTLLLDNSVDLHSYQPTADDIMKIATCDLFVYVGGESDRWVEDALREGNPEDRIVINLLDALGDRAREEELVPGMEAEEDEEEGDEEGPEYDEHVWLSLKNAAYLTGILSEAIQSMDADDAKLYQDNAAAYAAKLSALDQDYASAVSRAGVTTLLFGDRFPFRYLTEDYGLSYYAAFAGCSAETEASFETIIFLAQRVDELSLDSVMTIEGTDHKIAETIIQNTQAKNQQILTLNSMQSISSEDVKNGISYLSIMEDNLEVLKQALQADAAETSGLAAPALAGFAPLAENIDVDLTTLSSTMVYAEVFNMLCDPDSYVGKTVKMKGNFAIYQDDNTGNTYYACVIQDATACCAQGIEFVLTEDSTYPEEGDVITVEGVFDTYMEGQYKYFTLRDAVLV